MNQLRRFIGTCYLKQSVADSDEIIENVKLTTMWSEFSYVHE